MIIFDMDGTLLDSSKSITKSINYVRNKLGLKPFKVEEITRLINEPDNDLPKLFYEDIKPYNECRKIFEKHYIKNCIIDMDMFDGIEYMLESLKDEYILSVLTNAYGEFARKMLKHLRIDKYFVDILGSDDISSRRPNPKGIYHILTKYGIDISNTFFMGDSLKDEECAKNAGVKYIFADWGFGECKKPDMILSSQDKKDIKNILKRIA